MLLAPATDHPGQGRGPAGMSANRRLVVMRYALHPTDRSGAVLTAGGQDLTDPAELGSLVQRDRCGQHPDGSAIGDDVHQLTVEAEPPPARRPRGRLSYTGRPGRGAAPI